MKGAKNMKKSNLFVGIAYVLFGMVCLMTVILLDTKLDGILCGLGGAGIGSGGMILYKYFYWSSPQRKKEYQEKLKQEQIELHDELKEKLRDKSGRYAYLLGMMVALIFCFVVAVLDSLEIIEHGTIVVGCLSGYLILQYVAGGMIYRYLLKKYE